jgi:heme-degrading monooxygenase HmoA
MEQYREAIRVLKERIEKDGRGTVAGNSAWRPEQRFLVVYGDPNDVEFISVWETREAFERFMSEDMPLMNAGSGMNISLYHGEVHEVQDIIAASQFVER